MLALHAGEGKRRDERAVVRHHHVHGAVQRVRAPPIVDPDKRQQKNTGYFQTSDSELWIVRSYLKFVLNISEHFEIGSYWGV